MTTTQTTAPRATTRLPALTVATLAGVLGVCLVLGLYAAAAGGSASRLGSGPGGLAGVPQLALLAVAGVLGLPAALRLRHQPAGAVLVLGGALVVAFGYFFFSHALDPCATGLLDAGARVGGAPLCETGSYGTSTSERFHLLEHALSASLLLGAYVLALRGAGVLGAGRAEPEAR
jgi:hypothetical protein